MGNGTLLGFGDYFIGASAIKKPPVKAPVVKGPIASKMATKGGKPSPHKAAMVNTITAGKKAEAAGKKGTANAKAYKPSAHAPLVKLAAAVTPSGAVMLGAVAKILSPQQNAAVAKHVNAIARTAAANKALSLAASKAHKAGTEALTFAKTSSAFLKKALEGPPVKTVLGAAPTSDQIASGSAVLKLGSTGDAVKFIQKQLGTVTVDGQFGPETQAAVIAYQKYNGLTPDGIVGKGTYTALAFGGPTTSPYAGTPGALLTPYVGVDELSEEETVEMCHAIDAMLGVDAAGLSPGQPGYNPATDPSAQQGMTSAPGGAPYDPNAPAPATSGSSGGVDPTTGVVTGPDGSTLYDPSSDPAILPMPARGGTLSPSDAQNQWANVPADGIPYDGSKGFPDGSVGSFNTQYNHQDGIEMHADGWYAKQGSDYHKANPVGPNYGNDLGWGPLVGNPSGPLANLQWATADKKWFWQGANAPVAFTQALDSKITDANNKIIAANTATAVAQLAQMNADAAANAEAQAKQDAATALQQSADTQAEAHATSVATAADTVAQQQQQAAQAQQDIAYQTQSDALEASQGQANLEMLKQEAPIAAQQDQLDVDAQREMQHQLVVEAAAHNEWMKAHPDQAEAAYEAMQQGGGDDDGGDDDGGPSMFEENAQPQADDADPNWPHSDEDI